MVIKLYLGLINFFMLVVDLFIRLRLFGFCLLCDCMGGGVLGGIGIYLLGYGMLMNCCYYLLIIIVM